MYYHFVAYLKRLSGLFSPTCQVCCHLVVFNLNMIFVEIFTSLLWLTINQQSVSKGSEKAIV